jgi:hypothetical protein
LREATPSCKISKRCIEVLTDTCKVGNDNALVKEIKKANGKDVGAYSGRTRSYTNTLRLKQIRKITRRPSYFKTPESVTSRGHAKEEIISEKETKTSNVKSNANSEKANKESLNINKRVLRSSIKATGKRKFGSGDSV